MYSHNDNNLTGSKKWLTKKGKRKKEGTGKGVFFFFCILMGKRVEVDFVCKYPPSSETIFRHKHMNFKSSSNTFAYGDKYSANIAQES